MSTISVQVAPGYSKAAECRLLELSETVLNTLYEGRPIGSAGAVGTKRPREETGAEGGERTNEDGNDSSTITPVDRRLAFTVRGNSDEVVICTHSATFSLRRHEFSNNMYLMDVDTQIIHENANFLCEVQPTRSRLETIRSFLFAEEDTFLTQEELDSWDSVVKPSKYTLSKRPYLRSFQCLVEKSMCSRFEVAEFLTAEGALLVQGRVRLLDPALGAHVLESIIHSVNGNSGGWRLDSFPLEGVVDELKKLYPPVVVESVLSRVGEVVETGAFKLNSKKVMVELARSLLDPSITNINTGPLGTQNIASPLNDLNKRKFLVEWKNKISVLCSPMWLLAAPDGAIGEATQNANDNVVLTDSDCMAMLDGLTFTNNDTNSSETAVVTWCPHWKLPTNVPERVQALFARKQRWPGNELRGYINPCLDVGVSFDASIGKYCREIRSSDKAVPSTYLLA